MAKKLYLVILVCIIFILPKTSFCDEPIFTKAVKSKGDIYQFQIGEWSYEINMNSNGRRFRNDGKKENFKLPLERHCDYTVRIQYAQYSNDLILIYEEECGGEGDCKVLRLEGKSLRRKWIMHITGCNVSIGTIYGSHMYLAAIGFVSKIDLEKGVFSWKYDRLYDREHGSFNSFESPIVDKNEIIFREELMSKKKQKPPREIVVDDKTGKITIK